MDDNMKPQGDEQQQVPPQQPAPAPEAPEVPAEGNQGEAPASEPTEE